MFILQSLLVSYGGDSLVFSFNFCCCILSDSPDFFKSAASQTIYTLHKPLLDMMFKSTELCRALGQSVAFATALVKRLKNTDEAIVLRSLLKMLQLLHESHPTPQEWVHENRLYALVQEFALSERKVLVRQLAKKLLLDFKASSGSAAGDNARVEPVEKGI